MLIGLHSGFIDDAIMLQENNGSICTYLALLILWLFSVSTEMYWKYQPAHKLVHEMDHWKFSPWAHPFFLVLHCIQYRGCHSSSKHFYLVLGSVEIAFTILCFLPRKHFCIPTQSILMSLSDRVSNAKFHCGSLEVMQPGKHHPCNMHSAALLCQCLAISSRLNLIRERGAYSAVLLTDCCFGNMSITCYLL